MQVDPEAAKIVFESGVPIVMIPLEVTHTALVTRNVMEAIVTSDPSPFLTLVREILLFFSGTYRTVFAFNDPPLHDPCAIFYIAHPEAFQVCSTHSLSACLCAICFMWPLHTVDRLSLENIPAASKHNAAGEFAPCGDNW